ncbi:PREDICTED: zinc finger protein 821 [Chaetura pelagica]|uniref:zinc finger protein 821 n=1 Tax=Chaetura pelagica TaxID=8897 RepID=UPI0005232CC9|nr:PREDICTED: zinc finger protein 821 [Chaetura pelagica]
MSRRKQTTPNKVHWEEVFAGLEEQARQAMMKTNFPGALGNQRPAIPPLQDPDSSSSGSEDEETTQDEVSSHTSEEDGSMVKVKKELENAEQPAAGAPLRRENEASSLNADPLLGLSQCPLCQLECGTREQVIAHVYQHTAAVVNAKSYMCPVCGRALSSPGSLGRHLLIHSEDQLSNCAVCGARFTSHATFNRSGSSWRGARLIREREAKRLKRRLEKMDMMLRAQFGQDPSAMAALAAEMNFFQLPVSNAELESQLLGKMAFEEQSNSALH